MTYVKFDDTCALICDLCQTTTMEEKQLLAKLGTDMHNSKSFAKAYASEVKKEYLSYLRQKEQGTYQKQVFKDLDNIWRDNINKKMINKKYAKEETLLPRNLQEQFDNNQNTERLLAKIVKMRKDITSNS